MALGSHSYDLKGEDQKTNNVTAGCGLETWVSPHLGAPQSKSAFGAGCAITTHITGLRPLCAFLRSVSRQTRQRYLWRCNSFFILAGGRYKRARAISEKHLKIGERGHLRE